jgi:hypothetical protein
MFGLLRKAESWFGTFRKPQHPAVVALAEKITRASLTVAESLKPYIRAPDDKTRMLCWWSVTCEFLYLFMHVANRFAFKHLGHAKRCKFQNEIYPLIARPVIEVIFGHWPSHLKDGMESEFRENLNNAEMEYGTCTYFDSDDPFSQTDLFPKFASHVCELLGVEKGNTAGYRATFMKIAGLFLAASEEVKLDEAIVAVGKEL